MREKKGKIGKQRGKERREEGRKEITLSKKMLCSEGKEQKLAE